nr:RnfABCDGE type electron transport complex subunit B [Candidatus Pantoea edessiphila]
MMKIKKTTDNEFNNINQQKTKIILKKTAWIEEKQCIGCNKCAKICPIKAIIGTTRVVHTVMSDFCTACNLCIESCPVNCIKILSIKITVNCTKRNTKNIFTRLDYIYNHL